MQLSRNNALLIGGVVIMIALGGLIWYVTASTKSPASGTMGTSTPTEIVIDPNATSTQVGGYTIERVPVREAAQNAPDYRKSISYGRSISADAKSSIEKKRTEIVAALKADSTDHDQWMRLASLYQMAEDYKKAEAVWAYTSVTWNDSVSFANLAYLRDVYLKDYARAETNYKQALARNPENVVAWTNLLDMYKYRYKQNTNAPETLLRQGIQARPNLWQLHALLARYYRGIGKNTEAKTEYDAAITLAQKAKDTSAVKELEAEKQAL